METAIAARKSEQSRRSFFVTGTDTDAGKTIVGAALGRALARGSPPSRVTIVKLAQTGLPPGEEGDAELAARLAGCAWLELARFPLPADPWNAALAAGCAPLRAGDLAARIAALPGDLVVEGSGGAAVPLNAEESIADVAAAAGLPAVVAVALRLGCISHALLTNEYLRARGIDVAGAVLVERFGPVERDYLAQVERGLGERMPLLGTIPFEQDPARAVAHGAEILARAGDLAIRD